MRILGLSTFVLLLLAGCDNSSTDASASGTAVELPDAELLVVNEGNFQLALPVPERLWSTFQPTAALNGATGVMEVNAGPHFQIDVFEEKVDVEALTAELTGELFTWKTTEESDAGFIAQAVLPSGEVFYYHVFHRFHLGERDYWSRSRSGSTFTLEQVQEMRKCLEAVRQIP